LLHNHPHISSGAGTIGQKWPQYKGLSPTPLAIKKNTSMKRRTWRIMHYSFCSKPAVCCSKEWGMRARFQLL
jgi:hypothetical protein